MGSIVRRCCAILLVDGRSIFISSLASTATLRCGLCAVVSMTR